MKEAILDMRIPNPERSAEGRRTRELLFQFNQTMPSTKESAALISQLFDIKKNSVVHPPLYVNLAENVHIGSNVVIMPYMKMMSAGQIYIEDDVQIALNVSLLTNNHDPYDRQLLTIQDIHIGKGAWIGAGSTILPGITIGKHAIVGASSVVTHDVPDYAVAAGNPARIIRMLDPEKFDPAIR